jgi:hypothetical protein
MAAPTYIIKKNGAARFISDSVIKREDPKEPHPIPNSGDAKT